MHKGKITQMKGLIKKLLPLSFKRFIKSFPLRFQTSEKIFTNYYANNVWGDPSSKSGSGSNLEQTSTLILELPNLFNKYDIKSILDIPCGDFFWFKNVELDEKINYTGADIVSKLIDNNKILYSSNNLKFIKKDITQDKLPFADLIICRDCLVHLSFSDIKDAINNIKRSGSKYILTTHFFDRSKNHNITSGEWRTLNLTLKPFNFDEPIEIIHENCSEGGGSYADKTLALWKINDI